MLTRYYIEALLVDPEAAHRVWEAWFAGENDDLTAEMAWKRMISISFAIQ